MEVAHLGLVDALDAEVHGALARCKSFLQPFKVLETERAAAQPLEDVRKDLARAVDEELLVTCATVQNCACAAEECSEIAAAATNSDQERNTQLLLLLVFLLLQTEASKATTAIRNSPTPAMKLH